MIPPGCLPVTPARKSQLQFALRCAFQLPHAIVVEATEMDNPKMESHFADEVQGVVVTEAWIPSSMLTEPNSWIDVCEKGFSFDQDICRRPKFYAGNLSALELETETCLEPLDKSDESTALHAVVLCKLCVRLPCVGSDVTRDPDEEYDSVVSMYWNGKSPLYEYTLCSASQVLPVAYMVFQAEETLHLRQNCVECEGSIATHFHTQTEHYMCTPCASPLLKMKIMKDCIVPVEDIQPSILDFCEEHRENKVSYYCGKCLKCVCVKCKVDGSHSTPEYCHHILWPIQEAYRETKQVALLTHSTAFIKDCESKIGEIDHRVQEIEENMKECKDSVRFAAQRLCDQVEKIGLAKLGRLASLRHTVEKKKLTADNFDAFLHTLTENSPVDFLDCWPQHEKMRAQLLDQGVIHPIKEMSDIAVEGMDDVLVKPEESSQHPSQMSDTVVCKPRTSLAGSITPMVSATFCPVKLSVSSVLSTTDNSPGPAVSRLDTPKEHQFWQKSHPSQKSVSPTAVSVRLTQNMCGYTSPRANAGVEEKKCPSTPNGVMPNMFLNPDVSPRRFMNLRRVA